MKDAIHPPSAVPRAEGAEPPDVAAFLERLRRLPEARALFRAGEPVVVARAPGRLDVMGGIADYSGSLVLQLPIREAAFVALQRDPEPELRIVSLGAEANGRAPAVALSLAELAGGPDGAPLPYDEARRRLARDPQRAWAAYVAGAFLVLMRERGVRFPSGARILVDSSVPEGAGVSSSAALEVAAMQALAAAFGLRLDGRELALLCQQVENRVVGAPCGVMDQMTAACGREGHLLALLCQPAEIEGHLPVPPEIAFWGIDSGVRHSVAGADYGSVRVGAFMGYRILAELCGLPVEPAGEPGRCRVRDDRWGGFLANLSPSEFEQSLARHLPERMRGAEFLARYGGITDPVTHVEPEREYAVRVPTAHPIYEHFRVRAFAELLARGGAPAGSRRWELLGELMYQSHASYSACGLGCPATDRLVELVRAVGRTGAGRRPEGAPGGLYGAKITGGGSGGTVAVLGRRDAEPAVRAVLERYAAETGRRPRLFSASSPGAVAFGVRRIPWNPEG